MTAFDKVWAIVKESRICASEGCTENIRNYEGLHYEDSDGKAYCIGCGAKMKRDGTGVGGDFRFDSEGYEQ